MNYHVAYGEQMLISAEEQPQPITTVLICQNTLLRTGISTILAETPFALTQPATLDLSAFADETSVLYLVCEDRASEAAVDWVERIKAECPNARVVILADDIAPADLIRACRVGLNGFCSTAMSRDALIGALELVLLGEKFLPAKLCLPLLREMSSRHSTATHPPGAVGSGNTPLKVLRALSNREVQILRCLTKGSSNKEIARELGLADATVKVHVKAILRKVRLENRTQAAIWAKQHLHPAAAHETEPSNIRWIP